MSRTYEIVCHDCKQRLWIGQSPLQEIEKGYIYKTDEALLKLQSFLFSHLQHKLAFGDGEHLHCDDYENLDPD